MKVYFIRRHKKVFYSVTKITINLAMKCTSRVQNCTSSNIQFYLLLSANSKAASCYSKAPAKCLQFIHFPTTITYKCTLSSIFACLYLCSKSGKHKSASSSSNCSSNYSPVKWLWKKKCAFLQQKPSLWDIVFLSNVNHPRATTWPDSWVHALPSKRV